MTSTKWRQWQRQEGQPEPVPLL